MNMLLEILCWLVGLLRLESGSMSVDGAVPVQTTGLQLTITPASIVTGENNSVNLRCLLSNPPKANASVYVIWRFRHSSKPPPPTNWAFMHQEDDLVRCPDPPKNCEFVNQQRALQFFRETHAQLNRPANYLEEKGLIESRQLHTLHLHNVSKHCDGIFQCYILINLDAIEKRVEFHVWSPPTEPVGVYFIKETLPSGSVQAPLNLTSAHLGRITHQLIAGKKYYLSCVVSGANPRPLVRWAVKDHRTGRERVLQTGNFSSVTQSSWLPFSKYLDVQTTTNLSYQDDDGLLHCQVENSVGKMRSESVKLSLLYAPVINPFEKAIKRVLELAAIQQSCQAFGKPPASIKWIDKQGLLVSNSSDLHLPGITRNGVKDFICTASNYIGETRREITFDVLYPPQVFIPPSVMANEGERLEIACRADSNPPVRRIYWTVNSSASLGRSESSARYNSRTLVIPNVSQRNFGEYTCHAESVKNLAEILDEQEMEGLSKDRVEWWLTGYRSSATLTLSVHYHPGQTTLLVSPSDKVNEEETVMFRCLENSTSPGYPRPTIYWFKLNLAQIPHSMFHSVDWWSVPIQPVQTNSTSYVVHRAQMLDSGIYGCYPKNAMGEGRPSHTFLSVAGKPIIISSSPEMNFVEITDLKTFAPDESYHPKTALAGSTSPRSAPRVSLNCTLLGSSDMTVTWYYSPSDTKVSLGNEYKINMDDYNSASPRSPTEHYISQNSSKVTNLDITYVSSTLAIPFLHSYDVPTPLLRNWMQDPFLKCDPKSMPDYIDWTGETSFHIWRQLKQLQQADGLYRCEASSHLGNTSHTMRIRVQTVPVPLPPPEELIAYHTNPSDFKSRPTFIGPLICQFAARPPVTELTWWRERGTVLSLVHKTTLPEKEPKIQETRDAFILTGRPALSQFLISKALEQKRASLEHNQIYPSETTLFSAMWIKTSGGITATNYTCVASNALGNSSQKIQTVPQSQPTKVSKLWVLHTTSTSVILTWSPGFHGTALDLFSAVNFWDLMKEHQQGGTLRPFLQNLLHEWEIAKRCAQTFKLELVDHGRQKQGEMLGRSSVYGGLNLDSSNSAKEPDDFRRNTGILHALSSGHSTVVNITGLLPSHVYSARIIAERGNSRSLPSDRIIFITDAYKPTKPTGIVFDSAQRVLRTPKEDPAACVKVQGSGDGGQTWQNVIPWKHQLRMLRVNGIDASPYHIGSSCAPLSWSAVTEVKVLMAGVYRVQYCDIANPEECSEPINPKQDLPVYLLITVGCLCILVVAVLIGLFGYFICVRPRRRSKASCSFAVHRQPCSNEASSLIHGIPDTDVQRNDTAGTMSCRGNIPTEIIQWDQPLDAVADVTNRNIWNNSN